MRRMPGRRAALPALLTLFVLIVGASASTVLPSAAPGRSGPSFFADAVYVYQNGFCQILDTLEIEVKDGKAEIELPDGTIFDTLRIEGVSVYQVVLREDSPTLLPGDRVRLKLADGTMDGKVLELGEFWGIESANGTRYIRADQIRSFEVVDAAPPTPGTTDVTLYVKGGDGPRTIQASYIVRGLSWTPTYEIDVESKRLREWVTLRSPATIEADKLVLVVGAPSMVFQYDYSMRSHAYAGLAMDGGGGGGPGWEAGSFDHFHEYTLNQSFRFLPGETVRLHFLEGPIDLVKELVAHVGRWTGETNANVEWTFTNRFDQPLAGGTVTFYRAGRIIGQATMPYLPRNDDTRLTSGAERDIVVQTTGTCESSRRWHFDLEVANRDTENHTVFVRFSFYPEEKPADLDPTPTRREPNALIWRLDLAADETTELSGDLSLPGPPNGECT